MPDEIVTYIHELRWILDQVTRVMSTYPTDKLNWRPETGSANSAYAIVTHILSCTRVYVLGFGCDQKVTPERRQEFVASGTAPDDLIATTRRLGVEIESALTTLQPPALDRRFLPPRNLLEKVEGRTRFRLGKPSWRVSGMRPYTWAN